MLEDYEIICPLNYNTNQTINSYKARHKLTEETVILHSIDVTKYTNNETILNRINERKNIKNHPNLLKFLTVFEDKPFKILYIVSEYCYNGNLNTVIKNCTKEKRYLSEELICKLFYQLLCAIKTIPIEKFMGKLNIDEIFIDDDFNVKLLNIQIGFDKNQKMNDVKMYKLARIMYNLTTLKKFDKTTQNNEIKKVQYYYSTEFINLLTTLLKDHCLLYKNLDKILCNSTILLKSSQWRKDRSFFIVAQNSNDDLQKSKNLKEKEFELYHKEKQLKEKEHNLDLWKKRLVLIEKQINEKLLLLDHFKITNNKSNPTPWNDIDTSFSADCDDSIIITGTKLDSNIVKPSAFTRSKSERRVKFKGHSPLKKMNYSKRTVKKTPKSDEIKEDKSINSSSSTNSKLSKKLFDDGKTCRPISWNEDSKRQAFDLLRMMTSANEPNDIKHTYL